MPSTKPSGYVGLTYTDPTTTSSSGCSAGETCKIPLNVLQGAKNSNSPNYNLSNSFCQSTPDGPAFVIKYNSTVPIGTATNSSTLCNK